MMGEVEKISSENDVPYALAYGSLLGSIRENGFISWDTDLDITVFYDQLESFESALQSQMENKYELNTHKNKGYDRFFSRVTLAGGYHHDIHIDIFPLVGVADNVIAQKLFVNTAYYTHKIFYLKMMDHKKRYEKGSARRLQTSALKVLLFPIPKKLPLFILKLMAKIYPVSTSNYVYNIGGSYKMREVFKKEWFSNLNYSNFEGQKFKVPSMFDEYLSQVYGDYMTPKKKDYINK